MQKQTPKKAPKILTTPWSFFLQSLWGQPQTILGLFVFIIIKIRDPASKTIIYRRGSLLTRTTRINGGLSLGLFLFALDYQRHYQPPPTVNQPPGQTPVQQAAELAQSRLDAHEWGHFVQSALTGPLYLLVIGIPSFLRALLFRFKTPKPSRWYYHAYPENWADKLSRTFEKPNN